jgi:hypothetical protein
MDNFSMSFGNGSDSVRDPMVLQKPKDTKEAKGATGKGATGKGATGKGATGKEATDRT